MEKCFLNELLSLGEKWLMFSFGVVVLSKSLAVNLYYFYNQQKYL